MKQLPITIDSIKDKQTLKRTAIFEKFIAAKREKNEPLVIPLDELIKAGISLSAQYPAYWYGAAGGSRAAALLNPPHRVIFSQKLLLCTFVPMTEHEINMLLTRVVQQRNRARTKTTAARNHIRDLVSKMAVK